jgi:hypothetical protein
MENKNELNKKYQYGWYGTCEEDCQPLWFENLGDARKHIDSVVRVSRADGKSFEKYTSYDTDNLAWVSQLGENESFDDYINPEFKYMDCGNGYLVIRYSSFGGASP